MSDILGSYPKAITRHPRNVNADQFIQEYLKSEQSNESIYSLIKLERKQQQVSSQVRIRNPFYAGSVFYGEEPEQPKKQSEKALSINQNKSELLFSKKEDQLTERKSHVPDGARKSLGDASSIKSIKSKSTIKQKSKKSVSKPEKQQIQPVPTPPPKLENPVAALAAGRPTKKQAFSILPLNSQEKMQSFDKLPLIHPTKEVVKKTFDQNLANFYDERPKRDGIGKEYALYNPIAHSKLEYKPNRQIAASWDKYYRPQFGEFIAKELSPSQMVSIKNRIDCAVGFQTSSQAYGFGLEK